MFLYQLTSTSFPPHCKRQGQWQFIQLARLAFWHNCPWLSKWEVLNGKSFFMETIVWQVRIIVLLGNHSSFLYSNGWQIQGKTQCLSDNSRGWNTLSLIGFIWLEGQSPVIQFWWHWSLFSVRLQHELWSEAHSKWLTSYSQHAQWRGSLSSWEGPLPRGFSCNSSPVSICLSHARLMELGGLTGAHANRN